MSAVVVNLNPLVCLLSLFLCGFSVGAKLAKGVKNYLALCVSVSVDHWTVLPLTQFPGIVCSQSYKPEFCKKLRH